VGIKGHISIDSTTTTAGIHIGDSAMPTATTTTTTTTTTRGAMLSALPITTLEGTLSGAAVAAVCAILDLLPAVNGAVAVARKLSRRRFGVPTGSPPCQPRIFSFALVVFSMQTCAILLLLLLLLLFRPTSLHS
jgi:hypothetical protein